MTLSWGQKVFSKQEFREYANAKEEDFEAPMKKKLVCDAKKLLADGHVPKNKISTKVEGEEGDAEIDVFSPLTTNPREEPNQVSMMMREGVRRRGVTRAGSAPPPEPPSRNLVTEEPSREQQLRTRVITTPIETMEVRFDLGTGSRDEEGSTEEKDSKLVTLCTLTYSGNRLLTIHPDFCWSGRPYRLEVEGHEGLQYWLEHCSSQGDSLQREPKLVGEVYARQSQIHQAEVGEDFEMPPPGMFRLHLAAEIVKAAGFEYDNLAVNYLVALPPGWEAGEGSDLVGSTQHCYTGANEKGEDVAHFSLPITADLFFNINQVVGRYR